MDSSDVIDSETELKSIKEQASAEDVRVTLHAHQEMVDEGITLDDVLQAIEGGCILESYREHRRGPCCLICGFSHNGRPIHVVCTTGREELIIITVYEPKPLKWVTPTRRRL